MPLPDPVFWRSKILLAKLETAYGTDPVPTGAANAILATSVVLSPMEGSDTSRDLELPWMGSQGTIPTDLHRKLTFKVELVPSGTPGVAPGWGPLMQACGMVETIVADTSVAYAPSTWPQASVGFYFWIGDTLFTLTGARGTCTIRVNASGIPYLEFEFTGLYAAASTTARATPDLTGFEKPLVASKAHTPVFTLAGTTLKMSAFALAFGNTVTFRPLINAEEVLITDRADMIDVTIDAVPLTTLDPFGLAEAQTAVAISLQHGTAEGLISTLAIPAGQMMRTASLSNANGITQWPLKIAPLPTAGDDQFALTLT